MLSSIVGPVDLFSASVLMTLFVCVGIAATTYIGKYRKKEELKMQFEVDMQKLRNEDAQAERNNQRSLEVELAKYSMDRDVQIRRIDTGLVEATKN